MEVDQTASTNADLVTAIAAGEEWPHLSVLFTRHQTGGRGRLDRAWIAPAKSALAVSVVVNIAGVPRDRLGWIPLVAGTAMAEAAAKQLPGNNVGVKWPNDVLVNDQKICGILTEVVSADTVVVGSGINTRMTADQLPVPTATSFAALGVTVDEERLLDDYVAELGILVQTLETGTAASRVRSACLTIGQGVVAHLPGGEQLHGTAVGIDDDGRLLVDDRPLAAGDIVHLRRSAPADGV